MVANTPKSYGKKVDANRLPYGSRGKTARNIPRLFFVERLPPTVYRQPSFLVLFVD